MKYLKVMSSSPDNCVNTCSNYAFIGGGTFNTISGKYSAILGGKGNTVSHDYAGVFGSGLNSVSPNTFHVACLNASSTPPLGGAAPWTLTYITATAGMVGVGFPVGSKIAMIQ